MYHHTFKMVNTADVTEAKLCGRALSNSIDPFFIISLHLNQWLA